MDRALVLARLYDWNPWWKGQTPEIPAFRREAFAELERHLARPKAVILTGLRQTGKTTLLLQHIAGMEESARRRCCYLPLDQLGPDLERWQATLEEVLRLWSEEIAGVPLSQVPTKFVFLDEAHFVHTWAKEVKGILDRRWPVRFVVTGSAAVTLQLEAAKLLAGRSILQRIGPLKLRELVRARLEPRKADPILALAEDWRDLVEEAVQSGEWDGRAFGKIVESFAPWKEEVAALTARLVERGGFPEIALSEMDVPTAVRMMRTFLSMLVQKDFVEFFHVRDTRTLERLIEILAQGTGRLLVERKLASDVGAAVNTVRNHIGFLKNAGLVQVLRAYVESASRAARLPEKFHFSDSGLRAALVGAGPEDRGFVLDSLLYSHLTQWVDASFPGAKFAYWRQDDREVDLVIAHGRRLVGIEIHAKGGERKGLEAFRERYPKSTAWIVSEGTTGRADPEHIELPLGLMLLLA